MFKGQGDSEGSELQWMFVQIIPSDWFNLVRVHVNQHFLVFYQLRSAYTIYQKERKKQLVRSTGNYFAWLVLKKL